MLVVDILLAETETFMGHGFALKIFEVE